MEIYILDRSLDIIGVFSTYEAIIWNPKFHEPGQFKAEFIYSSRMNERLQIGNLLFKTDEDEAGIITRKYLKLNKNGEETIQIQGYMASRYLNQRIIWNKIVMADTVENIMRNMVYENAISTDDSSRIIPNLELGDLHGYEEEISKQITYDNLQESLTELSRASEIGYKLKLDIGEKKFYFETYKGTDRTSESEIPCVFSREYGNVHAQEFYEDITNYRNTCLVGGSGEDSDRIMSTVGSGNSGLDRYEMFYSASGMSSKDISKEEYIKQLNQKGDEKISAYYKTSAFESKINTNKKMKFELGDYVTCTDKEWGLTIDTQIKEIEKTFSKTEQSVVVTFGDSVPTLVQLIKAKE